MFEALQSFSDYLKNHFHSGANWIKLAICLAIVIVAIVLTIVISKVSKKKLLNNDIQKTSAFHLLSSVVRYAIIIVAILIILQINGINVTGLFASMGVATAIISVGLEEVFSDVFSGIKIMTEHFFHIGDVISVNGEEGVVEALSIRTTKIISSLTGNKVMLCNRLLSQIQLVSDINDINIPLPYEMPLKDAQELLQKVADRCAEVTNVKKCSYEGLVEFGESAILYRLRFLCDPKVRIPTGRQVRRVIYSVLNENHISIPFNQLDVEIKNTKKILQKNKLSKK